MKIDDLAVITTDVIEAACSTLVIGTEYRYENAVT